MKRWLINSQKMIDDKIYKLLNSQKIKAYDRNKGKEIVIVF